MNCQNFLRVLPLFFLISFGRVLGRPLYGPRLVLVIFTYSSTQEAVSRPFIGTQIEVSCPGGTDLAAQKKSGLHFIWGRTSSLSLLLQRLFFCPSLSHFIALPSFGSFGSMWPPQSLNFETSFLHLGWLPATCFLFPLFLLACA